MLGPTLRRAAGLLARNPVLLVPSVAIGAAAGIVQALLAPQAPDALETSHVRLWISQSVGVFASVATLAVSTGMADVAWRTGRARLADGARAFQRDGRGVSVVTLAMGLTGALAAVLAPYTAFLSAFFWAYFGMYAIAAAVVGERAGSVAFRESASLALRKPVTTLALVAGMSCVAVAATLLAELLDGFVHAGLVAAAIVTEASVAYLALVTAREYEALEAFPAKK